MAEQTLVERPTMGAAPRDAAGGPQHQTRERSYYDLSILQPPVWKNVAVGSYFFLGGLAGGAYMLARVAERFGGRDMRDVARAGSTVALLATLPCAPLLIEDLGDPSRFHHMLRVFKPTSPMNLGAWTLTGFGGAAAAAVFREWRRGRGSPRSSLGKFADQSLAVVLDAAGVPLALLLTSYTGVLLSGTANPLWTRNKWLAPLFASSAIGNGAAAIGLALELMGKSTRFGRPTPAAEALHRIDTAAHVAEIICLARYLTTQGKTAKPLLSGTHGAQLAGSVASLVAAEVLKYGPARGESGRRARILGSLLNLFSGLSLKIGILAAGKRAANDPHLARLSSRPPSGQQ